MRQIIQIEKALPRGFVIRKSRDGKLEDDKLTVAMTDAELHKALDDWVASSPSRRRRVRKLG